MSDLAASAYTTVRFADDKSHVAAEPVIFTRVRPGQTLLDRAPVAKAATS
jgi:hypothetical protein